MNELQNATPQLLTWIGHALFYGTMLAGVTWLLIRLGRKRIPAFIQTALWCIVLLKFLAPVAPTWSHSMGSLLASVQHAVTTTPSAGVDGELQMIDTPIFSLKANGLKVAPSKRETTPWLLMAMLAYGAIVLRLFVRRLRGYRKLYKQCQQLPQADAQVVNCVQDACDRLGVKRAPHTCVSSAADAPFVLGWWRPLLVLSHRHLGLPDQLETVVVHEVAHLRRGDFLVRYVQWIAGTLLFFWPVVAWVNRQIDLAREHACDEWALRQGKLSASEYARCLLDAVKHRSPRSGVFQPTCMASHPATIERRIDMILEVTNLRRGSAWSAMAIVPLLAWGGFALAGAQDPQESDEGSLLVVDESLHAVHEGDMAARKILESTAIKTKQWLAECQKRMQDIPEADADNDGHVSSHESILFLATKSMLDEEAVIDAYSYVDRNEDGELSLSEAMFFVTGHRPIDGAQIELIQEVMNSGQLHPVYERGTLTATPEDEWSSAGAGSIAVTRLHTEAVREMKAKDAVQRAVESDSSTENAGQLWVGRVKRVHFAGKLLKMHAVAGSRIWILDHIEENPTADEVAEVAQRLEEMQTE